MFKDGKEYMDEELSEITVDFAPFGCPYRMWAVQLFSDEYKTENPFLYITNGKSHTWKTDLIRIKIEDCLLPEETNIIPNDFKKIVKFINIYKDSLLDCWNHKFTTGHLGSLQILNWKNL